MKYGIDTKLRLVPTLIYGLQWWVVILPSIIVMGLVVAKLHFGEDIEAQTFYMQKLFAITGVGLIIQVIWGHRLPLVIGPASVLLIGILSSISSGVSVIYTSLFIGGVLIAVIAITGLLEKLQAVFTPRIITVILILVALTISPVIINLVYNSSPHTLFNMLFTLIFVLLLIVANKHLKGVWKATTLVWGILVGTLLYFFIFGFPDVELSKRSGFGTTEMSIFNEFQFDPGVIIAFVFCSLTLIVNELGSIQAVGHMLNAGGLEKRTTRGIGVTGIMNMVSGLTGVIGPVDYSTSPGIIASTGCASRYTLIPAGVGLLVCSFLPVLISALLYIPGVVMGTMLLYVMSLQLAASLQLLAKDKVITDFQSGITVGLPVMVTLLVSFAPAGVMDQLPAILRPVLGNGFVMGVMIVFLLEHVIFRKKY